MVRIEILVEEPSMKEFLTILLPNILDNHWILNKNYFIIEFQGKSDLQKNIPSRVKLLKNPDYGAVGIVIMQDQDSSDCKILKQKLIAICDKYNSSCPVLIRIICRELESWYLGDFLAVNKAYPSFKYQNYINKAKFRNPDNCNASYELKKIVPEFQKVSGAKKIVPFINVEKNKSESFKQTISGLRRFFDSVDKKTKVS